MSKARENVIVIQAWPQLMEALNARRLAMLGTTPEEIAKFLLVQALDQREQQRAANAAVEFAARASGWRGS